MKDLQALLAKLFMAYSRRPDESTFALYEERLARIPLDLLEAGINFAIDTREQFLPTVAQVKTDVETCRRQLRARSAVPSQVECSECNGTGWLSQGTRDQISRLVVRNGTAEIETPAPLVAMTRCRCRTSAEAVPPNRAALRQLAGGKR